jgi:hypothetical protein
MLFRTVCDSSTPAVEMEIALRVFCDFRVNSTDFGLERFFIQS